MSRRMVVPIALGMAMAMSLLIAITTGSGAFEGEKRFRLRDDCDPASFNAVLGPNACVGNGHTTVTEFNEELREEQEVHSWRFQPEETNVKAGQATRVENRGGEVHTFTKVQAFGGGFVAALNELSGNPVARPECLNRAGLVFLPAGFSGPGPTAGSAALPVGVHRFQCCIHPWMRSVIEVRAEGGSGGGGGSSSDDNSGHGSGEHH